MQECLRDGDLKRVGDPSTLEKKWRLELLMLGEMTANFLGVSPL